MKLYEVPNNTRIKIDDTETILDFKHLDGMYSYCEDMAGNPVNIVAWAEVEIVKEMSK